jgi:1,4-dihydroxy-6-naphthoate synthase
MTFQALAGALSLGYSPCPNDTFIFYALVHGRIDTAGLGFKETLLDVETLNQKALNSELDITKVSFHAFAFLRESYQLLRAGGALGRGCGPLVVAKRGTSMEDLRGKKIAIPGRLTTASLLLQLYDPALGTDVVVMPFDRIMDAVKGGAVDAGLIIHESRFTYPAYGLSEVMDLGRWWEGDTGLPLPLGCIIAKKGLGDEVIQTIDMLVRKSVEYAFGHRERTKEYIKAHCREMEEAVIEQHINLYVNDFSLDLGSEGMAAVDELLRRAEAHGIIPGGMNAAVR